MSLDRSPRQHLSTVCMEEPKYGNLQVGRSYTEFVVRKLATVAWT